MLKVQRNVCIPYRYTRRPITSGWHPLDLCCRLLIPDLTNPDTDLVEMKDSMHRNAYAILIKEANRLNMFEDSRFCKDVLRIITVIA